MKYKGYEAIVSFDDEAGIFHGEVINIRDVITFQGQSVDELRTAFRESVEDYFAVNYSCNSNCRIWIGVACCPRILV